MNWFWRWAHELIAPKPERWQFCHKVELVSGTFISKEEAERCAKSLYGPDYKKHCIFVKL